MVKGNRKEQEEEMKKKDNVNQTADLIRDRITEGKNPWPLPSLSNISVSNEEASGI